MAFKAFDWSATLRWGCIGIIFCLSSYAVYVLSQDRTEESFIPLKDAPSVLSSLFMKSSLEPSHYEEVLAKRDIFSLNGRPTAIQKAAEIALALSESIPTFFTSLKIVGIIIDSAPQAILSSPGTKETFFVRIGENLKEATVKAIDEEKVILNYQGRPFTLVR